MKATIDFDPVLYQRLKLEAVRRGRTVRDLVAEGVRLVLSRQPERSSGGQSDKPEWLGGLRRYAANARGAHDLESVRRSIGRGRSNKSR